MHNVIRMASLKEFINELPDGWETQIGERGSQISGGQKQRIAIARALYSGASILFFDEATSALDTSSQALLKNVIMDLKEEGKTIVVVTHRLNTITFADRIIVLDQGRVKEQGPHHLLIKKRGYYYKMWQEEYRSYNLV